MIRNILLLLFLFIESVSNAQTISGTILNLNDKKLVFTWTNDYLINKTDTSTADAKGNFCIRIPFKKTGFLSITNSNFRINDIYVWPSAMLGINADGKTAAMFNNTITYSGSAGFINNFFVLTRNSTQLKANAFGGDTYKMPPTKFTMAILSYFKIRDSIKQEYFKHTSNNKDGNLKRFLLIDSINNVYFKASAWFSYLNFLSGEEKAKFFMQNIQELAMHNNKEVYLSAPNYRYFWNNMINYEITNIREALPKEERRLASTYYHNLPILIKTNLTGEMKSIIAAIYLQNISNSYQNIENVKMADTAIGNLYRILDNAKVENYYRKMIKEKVEIRQLVKVGLPAKDFQIIDENGTCFSLKDFKGRIVYIDLWASWCGPCIAEIPDTKKLLAAITYPEKLAYISISLDDKKSDWLKALKRHDPPGQQFWAVDGFKSKMSKDYRIAGIPHYILIDEQGRLLQYAAPIPSSGKEIINLINRSIANIKP